MPRLQGPAAAPNISAGRTHHGGMQRRHPRRAQARPAHRRPPPLRAPTTLAPTPPQALDKVIALVDPSDETYTAQRALVAGDAAFYLTELLADPAVAARAAEAIAALCQHSAPARARLAAGPLQGLDSAVERVSLNPCQSGAAGQPAAAAAAGPCTSGLHERRCMRCNAGAPPVCTAAPRTPMPPLRPTLLADFVDSGAVAALVPMLLQRGEAAREAAGEAVAALCSYHHDGKLAQLEALAQALQRQPELAAQVRVAPPPLSCALLHQGLGPRGVRGQQQRLCGAPWVGAASLQAMQVLRLPAPARRCLSWGMRW